MPPRRAGLSNYYFVWRRQLLPRDRSQFLFQFKSDPIAMQDLRRVLEETFPGVPQTRLTDDQVLAGIGRLVSAGELLIAREEPRHGGSATPSNDSQPDSPPNAAPPSSASKAPPPENPTLPSNTNAAMQAAALTNAAAMGAGVCPT